MIPPAPALSGRQRFAIVIGNGSGYADVAALPKVDQDAASMAAMLRHVGFTVYGKVNATREQMERLVDEVAAEAARFDESSIVFYYSGHAVQATVSTFLPKLLAVTSAFA